MITTIRIQSVVDANPTEILAVDLRGSAFVGDKEGDHHKTVIEIDVDENSPLVSEALAIGGGFNAFMSNLIKEKTSGLPPDEAALVPNVCLRVMDKVAPKS